MKIVLINSPVRRRSPHSRLAPPLGLAYIASVLLMEGYEVSAVDFNVSGLNLNRVDRLVEVEKPALVGISAHTETYPNALQIARRIKAKAPETKVVLGGPHPTLLPGEILAEEAVDFVVVGEGEETMVELARHLTTGLGEPGDIKGLGYKDRAGPRVNARRKPLHPDAFPYPARELFPLEFYEDKWNVLTARGGCPFKCPFCSASAIWGGRRRARIPKHVVGEVEALSERYGATYVFFADDIFTLNHRWVRELLDLLVKLDRRPEWGCATRVDLVDQKLLREMAKAGCRAIQFGVESGSQRILDSVKGIKKEQVLRAVQAAVGAGIEVASSFMIPFPEDTRESIKETKDFIKQLYYAGSKVLLSYTSPYPGTHFYQNAAELGIKLLTDRWEEFDAKHNVLETKHLSAQEIEELVQEIVEETGLIKAVV
ncbi:MAG: radical SAM protein [Bacillota bacterium]|nr:radical SAM protein [Bacillota bacterium]